MKEHFIISGWELDIDIQATMATYSQPNELCDCAPCQNFLSAYSSIPKGLTIFLKTLGIDSSKPVYISGVCQNQDGTYLYIVYYDLIGEIIFGPDYNANEEPNYISIFPVNVPPTVNSAICGVATAPGHFPNPAIELRFTLSVPWVLNEPANND